MGAMAVPSSRREGDNAVNDGQPVDRSFAGGFICRAFVIAKRMWSSTIRPFDVWEKCHNEEHPLNHTGA